jgi:hypothetical protein
VRRYDARYWLLALTALLMLLWVRSSYGAEAPEVVLKRVPPGWTAEEEGYYLNTEALSSLTAASKTYRLERDAWMKAYYELSDKSESFRGSVETQIKELRRQLDEERSAWKSSLRKARSPGFGVFAGAGYAGGEVEVVVGMGLVWRLF